MREQKTGSHTSAYTAAVPPGGEERRLHRNFYFCAAHHRYERVSCTLIRNQKFRLMYFVNNNYTLQKLRLKPRGFRWHNHRIVRNINHAMGRHRLHDKRRRDSPASTSSVTSDIGTIPPTKEIRGSPRRSMMPSISPAAMKHQDWQLHPPVGPPSG